MRGAVAVACLMETRRVEVKIVIWGRPTDRRVDGMREVPVVSPEAEGAKGIAEIDSGYHGRGIVLAALTISYRFLLFLIVWVFVQLALMFF